MRKRRTRVDLTGCPSNRKHYSYVRVQKFERLLYNIYAVVFPTLSFSRRVLGMKTALTLILRFFMLLKYRRRDFSL